VNESVGAAIVAESATERPVTGIESTDDITRLAPLSPRVARSGGVSADDPQAASRSSAVTGAVRRMRLNS
jgi:hypothetical protein